MKHLLSTIAMIAALSVSCTNGSKPSKPNAPQPLMQDAGFNNCTPTNTATTNGALLRLNSETTYEGQIKGLISTYCLSCHNTQSPNLSTYDSIKDIKYDIVDVAKGDLAEIEHSSLSLSNSDVDRFVAWSDAGFPRGDINTSDPLASSAGYDNCSGGYVSGTDTTSTVDDLSDLINPEEKKDCDDRGLVFNRENRSCFESVKLDSAWCGSVDSIANTFQSKANAGNAVRTEIQNRQSQGFEIDQCGMDGNTPVVTMYKKVPAEEKLETAVIRAKSS